MPTPLLIHPLIAHDDQTAAYLVECAESPEPALLEQLARHPALERFPRRLPWILPVGPDALPNAADDACFLYQVSDPALADPTRPGCLLVTLPLSAPTGNGWRWLIVPASQARAAGPDALHQLAAGGPLVATGILGHPDRQWANTHGCSVTTSEFLLATSSQGKKPDLTRLKLIELLALLSNDADTASLEKIIRQEPKLSYSLLRLVNSAANSPRSPITSFTQAINLLGRRQLQRWLQLLVYAGQQGDNDANPLLQRAATRGYLFERLFPRLGEEACPPETAFMAGCFSLLDILLNMPMGEIINAVPLPLLVIDTLAGHHGQPGQLLRLLEAIDCRDLARTAELLDQLSISPAELLDAQMDALAWASSIRTND